MAVACREPLGIPPSPCYNAVMRRRTAQHPAPFAEARSTVCQLLRDIRQEAQLKQTEVAARLQVHQSFVSKYENGDRTLDIIELRAVCQALEIPLATFAQRLDDRLAD